jgi:hypothetical protein
MTDLLIVIWIVFMAVLSLVLYAKGRIDGYADATRAPQLLSGNRLFVDGDLHDNHRH